MTPASDDGADLGIMAYMAANEAGLEGPRPSWGTRVSMAVSTYGLFEKMAARPRLCRERVVRRAASSFGLF